MKHFILFIYYIIIDIFLNYILLPCLITQLHFLDLHYHYKYMIYNMPNYSITCPEFILLL